MDPESKSLKKANPSHLVTKKGNEKKAKENLEPRKG